MQETTHPTDERLEAFSDGSLPRSERADIESHVHACGRCRAEIADWKALFASLSALPSFSPAPGFADRVMAHVHVPEPATGGARDWFRRAEQSFGWFGRLLPHTTPGWALAVALLSMPVLAIGTLAFWLLSRSYLTAYRLWVFSTDLFATGANQVASGTANRLVHTDVAVWLIRSVTSFLGSAGMRGAGVLAASVAAVLLVSAWVLYRNLFRTPNRGSTYVSYTF